MALSIVIYVHRYTWCAKVCPEDFSDTTGHIVLIFWEMVDMDVKLFNGLQFK